MKKVLLTSTALVAFGGMAAAEVSISGNAEMGIVGGNVEVTTADGTEFDETAPAQFFNDVDVDFDMSGTTDGGLAFGASVDLDEAGNLGNEEDDMGITVFISSDFGTLTMGDTDGALDFVMVDMGNAGNPGSINDAETGHLGYLGSWLDGSGDGQIVRYDYSFDAFTFAVSAEQEPSGPNGTVLEDDDDVTWAIGGRYEFEFGGGSAGVGLGYQWSSQGSIQVGGDADDQTVNISLGSGEVAATAVGVDVALDAGFTATLTYTNFNFDEGDDVEHIGVGGGYTFDAFSVHANYGQYSTDDIDVTGYGLSAGYDLGGGASILAGYGNSSADEDDSDRELSIDNYSLGLSFSF
jgi:outer membrane protein OmpU